MRLNRGPRYPYLGTEGGGNSGAVLSITRIARCLVSNLRVIRCPAERLRNNSGLTISNVTSLPRSVVISPLFSTKSTFPRIPETVSYSSAAASANRYGSERDWFVSSSGSSGSGAGGGANGASPHAEGEPAKQ